jgi:ppGpp synthetase/RelA/SpoT-type nucleotidyltranferase
VTASTAVRVAKEFLAWYGDSLPGLRDAASQLAAYLQRLLADNNIPVHVVSARAKDTGSVCAKLLTKQYARPRSRLTDRVGARIILYQASDVDRVAALLREHLTIREKDSTDKRTALGLREFGYRSYHLVGSLPPGTTGQPAFRALRGTVFEIQVRSLLEHAWAEIEHTTVYKSGADFPAELKRRFAALAGVLELLEHEFQQLTVARNALIDVALRNLQRKTSRTLALDVPRTLALLELRSPTGRSFRQAATDGQPFPPGIERRFVLALRLARIRSVGALDRAMASPSVARLRRRYAAAEGIPVNQVSHLAALALVLGSRHKGLLDVFFPEFMADASLRAALP